MSADRGVASPVVPARATATHGGGSPLGRLWEVCRIDLAHGARRPLFWFLILLIGFMTLELSRGHARLGSGSTSVGGGKAFITSEFAIAQIWVLLTALLYLMFTAVAAGMTLIRDGEQRVGDLIHATALRPGEYVWGKFLGVLGALIGVVVIHTALMMFFNHGLPHGENVDVIGPFVPASYLMPPLLFALPVVVMIAGVTFAFGAVTRQPIVVFFVPVAVLIGGVFLFWEWSPSWLSPSLNRLLMAVDLTGYRWLKETWLDVDRGVAFYNRASIGLDGIFWLNRALCLVLGLGAVQFTAWHFARRLGGVPSRRRAPGGATVAATAADIVAEPAPPSLARIPARGGVPGLVSGAWQVARIELRELWSTPGIYLFVPLILLQTFGSAVTMEGAFDAPMLHTPGLLAVGMFNTLTLLICLLLLFYTTESLQRERSSGIAAIAYASPLRTASLLFGKALANTAVGLAVVGAVLAGCLIDMAIRGTVPIDLGPFALTWGLLLAPTFLVWTAFVSAAYAVTNNRYGAYGIGLIALIVTGWAQARNHMNWVGNWDLWSTVRWSDISVFELDRGALVLNRIMVLGLAVFFTALTVRLFGRREPDATRVIHGLRPSALGRAALGMAPYAVVPLAVGIVLWLQVQAGLGGGAGRKLAKDYWKQNVATWADAPIPGIGGVDLDVDLEPARGAFRVHGRYDLVNRTDKTLTQVPITGGPTWDSLSWTMNGQPAKPENRSRLYVFTPERPLAPGDTLRVGFRYQGRFPKGISKNGGGSMFFALPSSVVLTGFDGPSFAPIVGFVRDIGVEDANRTDPKVWPPDFERGTTAAYIASGEQWFDARIRVTGPEEFRYNSVGVRVSDEVKNGRRTTVWQTDHPVRIWNIIAGKWAEKKGDGVTIDYHPSHAYNVDVMMQALEGSRRWYSEWFTPYPWRDLRLSEFPNLATYAQGPPTNITFSEGIGFLTKSEPKANLPFFVTAHEAAHQWWGNILMPGIGPGSVILSEGMAHYSTILLTEKVKGLEQRIAFCRNIEDRYGNFRRSDDEKPLMGVTGDKPTDRTIIYDKGGWVMWMLTDVMGRDAMLAGLRDFIATYRDNPDHPTLEDLIVTLRPHAPDPAAFDAFVDQWFRHVVVPEYKLGDMKVTRDGADWVVRATVTNTGTGRMPVEVAAVRGERFPDPKKKSSDAAWRETRTRVVLAAGQSTSVTLRCGFEPKRLVVDPDARVLQLQRSHAEVDV